MKVRLEDTNYRHIKFETIIANALSGDLASLERLRDLEISPSQYENFSNQVLHIKHPIAYYLQAKVLIEFFAANKKDQFLSYISSAETLLRHIIERFHLSYAYTLLGDIKFAEFKLEKSVELKSEALSFYKLGCVYGDARAFFILGEIHESEGEDQLAYSAYQESAKLGDKYALVKMADRYQALGSHDNYFAHLYFAGVQGVVDAKKELIKSVSPYAKKYLLALYFQNDAETNSKIPLKSLLDADLSFSINEFCKYVNYMFIGKDEIYSVCRILGEQFDRRWDQKSRPAMLNLFETLSLAIFRGTISWPEILQSPLIKIGDTAKKISILIQYLSFLSPEICRNIGLTAVSAVFSVNSNSEDLQQNQFIVAALYMRGKSIPLSVIDHYESHLNIIVTDCENIGGKQKQKYIVQLERLNKYKFPKVSEALIKCYESAVNNCLPLNKTQHDYGQRIELLKLYEQKGCKYATHQLLSYFLDEAKKLMGKPEELKELEKLAEMHPCAKYALGCYYERQAGESFFNKKKFYEKALALFEGSGSDSPDALAKIGRYCFMADKPDISRAFYNFYLSAARTPLGVIGLKAAADRPEALPHFYYGLHQGLGDEVLNSVGTAELTKAFKINLDETLKTALWLLEADNILSFKVQTKLWHFLMLCPSIKHSLQMKTAFEAFIIKTLSAKCMDFDSLSEFLTLNKEIYSVEFARLLLDFVSNGSYEFITGKTSLLIFAKKMLLDIKNQPLQEQDLQNVDALLKMIEEQANPIVRLIENEMYVQTHLPEFADGLFESQTSQNNPFL